MFIDKWKWKPVYAPDAEGGVSSETETGGTPPPTGGVDDADEKGTSERPTLRQQLEKSVESLSKRDADAIRDEAKGVPKSRARQHLEAEGQVDPKDRELEPEKVEGEEPEKAEEKAPAIAAPAGFSAEAKAEWAKVPPTVQAAVVKREQDMAKGVEELKGKYADIDKVLAPRLESMRRFGHKPADAVNQLFAWFDALQANPDVAFPALAASFRYDLKRLLGNQTAPAPAAKEAPVEGQPDAAEVPDAVRQYITNLEQKMEQLQGAVQQQFGNMQNNFQQQQQAKTDEMLGMWSKDKPHFEKVRQLMGKLIIGLGQDNSVPLLANGAVDLDQIYDMAIHASPEVRAEILAAQETAREEERKKKVAAERKAQQDAADKAKRTAVGIAPGAPGRPTDSKKVPGKGKSVRESLKEAMGELSER